MINTAFHLPTTSSPNSIDEQTHCESIQNTKHWERLGETGGVDYSPADQGTSDCTQAQKFEDSDSTPTHTKHETTANKLLLEAPVSAPLATVDDDEITPKHRPVSSPGTPIHSGHDDVLLVVEEHDDLPPLDVSVSDHLPS